MVTVSELLSFMNLASFNHVLIRRKTLEFAAGFEYMGGGLTHNVKSRFGDMVVERCVVWDNKLVIYVY